MSKSPKNQQAAEPSAPKNAPTHPGVTSVQLLTVLTSVGVPVFSTTLEAEKPSLPVLKKLHALIEGVSEGSPLLAVRADALAAIDAHCTSRGLQIVPSRGRQPPQAGERRRYRVQQLAEGGPFLRLSMSSLGLKKGDHAHVDFENGRIVVTSAPGSGPADDDDVEE